MDRAERDAFPCPWCFRGDMISVGLLPPISDEQGAASSYFAQAWCSNCSAEGPLAWAPPPQRARGRDFDRKVAACELAISKWNRVAKVIYEVSKNDV